MRIPKPLAHGDAEVDAATPDRDTRYSHVPIAPFKRADEWIDSVSASLEHLITSGGPCQAALLQQLPPAITIEPFDGDPRKWDQFIGSYKALVHDVVSSNAQRIAILKQLLTPRIRTCIAPQLCGPSLYAQALKDLRRLFGDPNLIVDAYIKNLLDITPMRSDNCSDVERFFFDVQGAVNTLRTHGASSELTSRTTLQAVVSKMIKRLQSLWARRSYDLRPRPANLCDLDVCLEEIVTIQSNAQSDVHEYSERQVKKLKQKETHRYLNTVVFDHTPKECPVCGNGHQLINCSVFSSSTPQQRAETLKKHGRCFACFEPNHQARKCKHRCPCNIDNCRLKHHLLLHGATQVFPTRSFQNVRPEKEPVHICSGSVLPFSADVLLSIVRARLVTNDNNTMEVNVLLDPGSEATLIRGDIARKLSLTGPAQNIRLGTFHGIDLSKPEGKIRITFFGLSP
ncbi:hypothetical protein M514_11731 [Trichuris suis]|uniref:Peptidase A2 domain-containing protein n=1 Tax=Trichuris suis TaxID=68888 RepID=A0A085MW01_9BILA|nr:hypothetical protein M514_11731 [Trichuris suis]